VVRASTQRDSSVIGFSLGSPYVAQTASYEKTLYIAFVEFVLSYIYVKRALGNIRWWICYSKKTCITPKFRIFWCSSPCCCKPSLDQGL